MMRFFAYVLLAAAAVAGCGETAASTPPADAGSDASIDPDAGIDFDGSVDDDGGIPPDGGGDGGNPDAGGSWCNTNALCPACPDPDALCDPASSDPCPLGEVCLSTGCDELSRCFVTGGGGCQNNDDCGNPAYECNQVIGRCLRASPGCDDSNDCVAGFACEDGECTDRRVPCEIGSDCPHGFTCFFASPDQRFCRRITRPCGDDIDCLTLGVPCGDADGDGFKECMPSLTPNAADPVSCDNSQCLEDTAPVCESTVQGTVAVCGQFGLCASSGDCADGFECSDLWGDGRAECVVPGGSCEDSRECALRNVCASSRAGAPPACLVGAAM
jgi:hypothetical protein